MIPTVLRPLLLCLLVVSAAGSETLDEAVRSLAKKVSARLAPSDAPKVSVRNLSSLGDGEAARAKAAFERSLRRSAAHPVEVLLTVSQSLEDCVLVAEFNRDGERVVEMVRFRPEAVTPNQRLSLQKRLQWEQVGPILDVIVTDEDMIVLEPRAITIYVRRAVGWERAGSKLLEPVVAVRDPRGRLQVADGRLTAFLPGTVCRGTWKPSVDVRCEAADAEFELAGEQVKWRPARNTLEAVGWPPFYSLTQVDEESRRLSVLAESDGRTRLYDGRKAAGVSYEGWGSDLVSIAGGCGKDPVVLVTGPGDGDAPDSITAYRIADRKPVQMSDPTPFGGPVTALWPAANGAVAISRNPGTEHYAAYSIAVDCGR